MKSTTGLAFEYVATTNQAILQLDKILRKL
jgi:hypothetical protein